MSQVTYKNRSEKTEKKKVEFYNGTGSSVTLHQGYAFCYDQDYGTASDASLYRIWRVERPATANLLYFAGVLTEGYDGEIVANGETKVVEIYVPNRRGQGVLVWTEESCTINATYLAPQNGVFALGAASDSYTVALAAQTVDRSVTNGTVLARLFGVDLNQVGIESELTAAESELDLVSEAVVAVGSQLLLLESEAAGLASEILLLESETAEVVDSDAITSGIVTTSSVTIHKAQISIRGVTYTFVTDIVAKA